MAPKLAPGMERLLGVSVDGYPAGIELPTFFQNVLLCAHEQGAIGLGDARKAIARSHAHQFSRMAYLYKDAQEEGVAACLRVVLSQMVLVGLLVEDDGLWRPGPAFGLDKQMLVVQASDGDSFRVELPSVPQTGPTFNSEQDQMREDIKVLVQKLEPQGPGLRPVTREGVEDIKKSLLEYGLTPGYPLLFDQQGRVLSGRHRMTAEAELKAEGLWDDEWGEGWPRQVVRVADDREALRIAMAGNCARPWTAKDYRRLEKEGLGSTRREAMRRLVVLALLENAQRSDRSIADLVGCTHPTVAKARAALEQTGKIFQFADKGGRPAKARATSAPLVAEATPQVAAAPAPPGGTGAPWNPGPEHRRLYDYLVEHGPATDAEIRVALSEPGTVAPHSTIPTRRERLVAQGWVRNTGRLAPSPSGRRGAILWEAVPEELRRQPCQEAEAPQAEGTPASHSPEGTATADAQPPARSEHRRAASGVPDSSGPAPQVAGVRPSSRGRTALLAATPRVLRGTDRVGGVMEVDLEDLALRINVEHERCATAMRASVHHALEAGQLLLQAKAGLPHGAWLPWLHEHCTVPERTAQLYMRLARELPARLDAGKNATVADLSVREAIALLTEESDSREGAYGQEDH